MHDELTAASAKAARPVFAEALGAGFAALPPALRALHDVTGTRVFAGRADVERGAGLLSRLAGAIVGFPPAGRDVPVRVTMRRIGAAEVWTRDFAGRTFRSWLSVGGPPGSGRVRERFGAITLLIALDSRSGGTIAFPVVGGWLLGVPLPRLLLPRSDTRESVDGAGRARFDVAISLPLAGHVATYRGWLLPEDS